MRRLVLPLVLLAALVVPTVAGARPRQASAPRGTVYVTERQLGSVTALDAATGAVRWTTMVGATPIGVTRPRGTHKVYSSDEGAGQMSVLDRRTGRLLRTIPMGLLPHHLMASSNGRRIYVGEFGQNTVGVIDTRRDRLLAHWVANPLANARTHAVFITRNGKHLYTTNTRAVRTEIGDVAHLDARTGRLLCNTTVGADPSEILVTPTAGPATSRCARSTRSRSSTSAAAARG